MVEIVQLLVFFLFKKHLKLNFIESFRPPIFSYGQDKNGFNMGVKMNFADIFGSDKLKWFFPIFTRF